MELFRVINAAKKLGLVPLQTNMKTKKMVVVGKEGSMYVINFDTLTETYTGILAGRNILAGKASLAV